MAWNAMPLEVRDVIERGLTDKQVAAVKLEIAGLSLRAIARHLDVARQTAADRLEGAHGAMRRMGVRQDEFGRWTLTKEAV